MMIHKNFLLQVSFSISLLASEESIHRLFPNPDLINGKLTCPDSSDFIYDIPDKFEIDFKVPYHSKHQEIYFIAIRLPHTKVTVKEVKAPFSSQCPKCRKSLVSNVSLSNLQVSMMNHICRVCCRDQFNTQLNKLKKKERSDNESCGACFKEYDSERNYINHLVIKHTKFIDYSSLSKK